VDNGGTPSGTNVTGVSWGVTKRVPLTVSVAASRVNLKLTASLPRRRRRSAGALSTVTKAAQNDASASVNRDRRTGVCVEHHKRRCAYMCVLARGLGVVLVRCSVLGSRAQVGGYGPQPSTGACRTLTGAAGRVCRNDARAHRFGGMSDLQPSSALPPPRASSRCSASPLRLDSRPSRDDLPARFAYWKGYSTLGSSSQVAVLAPEPHRTTR
jgi:hypothetical protein